MFNHFRKKFVSLLLACIMVISISVPALAANVSDNDIFQLSNLSAEDITFLEKYTLVLDGFTADNGGNIVFGYSDLELKDIYGFSDSEISRLHEITNVMELNPMSLEDVELTTNRNARFFVSGSTIYFENYEVTGMLMTAASAGPVAMYALLVGLGTISLGPIGTTVAIVLGIIGAPSLASFCYYVIQAGVNGQGVYIGFYMNGIFPMIDSGTW